MMVSTWLRRSRPRAHDHTCVDRAWKEDPRQHYYRARYYHPGLQRFISEDPIEFAAGDTNLYIYVGNDPVGFVDPLGPLCHL